METRVSLILERRVVIDGRPWCVKMLWGSLLCMCIHVCICQQIIILLYISWPYLIILPNVALYQVLFLKKSLLRYNPLP